MKAYLITALLAVATVGTASANTDWLNDAQAPRADAFVMPSFGEACKQRGGSPVTLMPRTDVGNPWAKSKAPIPGCWEAKVPIITFAEGPPIQIMECEWRKLFEELGGGTWPKCYMKGRGADYWLDSNKVAPPVTVPTKPPRPKYGPLRKPREWDI